MNKSYRLLLYLFFISSFYSCSKSISSLSKGGAIKKTDGKVSSELIKSKDYTIQGSMVKGEPIELNYLGCGGFAFQRNGKTVLIDPYFSPIGPLPLMTSMTLQLKNLQSDSGQIREGLRPVFNQKNQKIHSIWVSHSHYDHLMDVPYIFENYPKVLGAKVYGSSSTYKLLVKGVGGSNLKILGEQDSSKNKQVQSFEKDRLKITSLVTSHAPHYRFLGIPISFFCGQVEKVSKDKDPLAKSKASKWKLGQTYAFVLDYLDEQGEIEYRIFIQSSASFPQDTSDWVSLRKEHAINLAIIGAASFKNVKNYPTTLMKSLKPEKAIICHWEDFFVDFNRRKERVVRATNIKKFIALFHTLLPYKNGQGEENFIMPKPGVNISIEGK